MPDPNYAVGKNSTLTLGGIAVAATDVSLDVKIGTEDVTNLTSGGYKETVADIREWTITCTVVLPASGGPTLPDDGTLQTVALASSGWKSFSGTGRITTQGAKSGPKGAVKIATTIEGSGSYTYA